MFGKARKGGDVYYFQDFRDYFFTSDTKLSLKVLGFEECFLKEYSDRVEIANANLANLNICFNALNDYKTNLELFYNDYKDKYDKRLKNEDESLNDQLEQEVNEAEAEYNELVTNYQMQLNSIEKTLRNANVHIKNLNVFFGVDEDNKKNNLLNDNQNNLNNVKTKPKSNDFVEFAIKFPGKQVT
mgnify:CR=1 FL=1